MYNPIKKQITLCVCVSALCFSDLAVGQEKLLQDNGCLYSVEGNCIPRRTTYGFYQTHWRAWPFATPPKVPTLQKKIVREPNGSTVLPDAEVPRPKDEAALSPDLPSKPEEITQDVQPAPADTQYQLDRQVDPFKDETPNQPRNQQGSDDLLQEPATSPVPSTQPAAESPFGDDLDDLDGFPTGSIRLDRQGLTNRPQSTPNPLRRYRPVVVPAAIPTAMPASRFVPTARNVSHVVPIRKVPIHNPSPAADNVGRNPLR